MEGKAGAIWGQPDPPSQTSRVYMKMLTSIPSPLELRKLRPREGAGTF